MLPILQKLSYLCEIFFFCCPSVGNNSADFCYGQKGMRPKIMEVILMNEKKKPGVMFYFDQCAIFRQMPMEDVYALVMATLDFAENGVMPEFKNPALTYAWSFIQLSVERDSARYDRVVEQRRKAAERRWAKKQQDEMNADACI